MTGCLNGGDMDHSFRRKVDEIVELARVRQDEHEARPDHGQARTLSEITDEILAEGPNRTKSRLRAALESMSHAEVHAVLELMNVGRDWCFGTLQSEPEQREDGADGCEDGEPERVPFRIEDLAITYATKREAIFSITEKWRLAEYLESALTILDPDDVMTKVAKAFEGWSRNED